MKRYRELVVAGIVMAFVLWPWMMVVRRVRAMEYQEVRPYCFADLPHGRIYKTVHEGCELYIVENDGNDTNHLTYAIATGRGCK